MEDIRVVHDRVGVYSDWKFSSFHEGIQEPWLTRHWHDYFEGKAKPHFPVPALKNHLYFIAAEPMEPQIDFKAIGWYGLHTSQY